MANSPDSWNLNWEDESMVKEKGEMGPKGGEWGSKRRMYGEDCKRGMNKT